MIAAFVIAAAIQVSPAAEADALAKMTMASGACTFAGYQADSEGGAALAEDFADRYPEGRGEQLYRDALAVESVRLASLLETAKDSAGATPEVRRVRAEIFRSCAEAKAAYPTAFLPSDDEGLVFGGYMGLMLDFPLVEEADYYMLARGMCAEHLGPFDADEAADGLVAAYPSAPASALIALQAQYATSYRAGLDDGDRLTSGQCERAMTSARTALRTAWSTHWGSVSQPMPFQP